MPQGGDELKPVTGYERSSNDPELRENDLPDLIRQIRARTPARLLLGRAGGSYRTTTQIELREAHAAARDAVRTEIDLQRDLGPAAIARWNLFEVCTQAASKEEYLQRPDLGRHFNQQAKAELRRRCPGGKDLQIAIGDGLSVTSIRAQVPELLDFLCGGAIARQWTVGQPFVIRHCRVGILNDIGELLSPKVVVLLIGERPGLATASSLSAYMGYAPKDGHSDADRNLISNIHASGVDIKHASLRVLNLAAQMMGARTSGYTLREELSLGEG